MNFNTETRARLLEHCSDYPQLMAEDICKYLFQSAFGCEHLVADFDAALAYIQREIQATATFSLPGDDRLDGDYSRISLSHVSEGLHPETLARLFCLSAKSEENGPEALREKLAVAKEMADEGILPVVREEFHRKVEEWAAIDYPAIHHSERFRAVYHPAYRVIANRYAKHLELFTRIDQLLSKGPAIVVIEGGSANGKTTLASMLQEVYGCAVFHTDDFFLRPEQRTEQRCAEVGGNLDRERFLEEVVTPLTRREPVCYRPFHCMTQSLGAPITVEPAPLTVVEGAYSMHPAFGIYYDLAVFLEISPALQRERILARNTPPFAKRFFEEWIPRENAYFTEMNIRQRAHLHHKLL